MNSIVRLLGLVFVVAIGFIAAVVVIAILLGVASAAGLWIFVSHLDPRIASVFGTELTVASVAVLIVVALAVIGTVINGLAGFFNR